MIGFTLDTYIATGNEGIHPHITCKERFFLVIFANSLISYFDILTLTRNSISSRCQHLVTNVPKCCQFWGRIIENYQ